MLRFPLKREILLLTEQNSFIGTVIFAGHDSLTVVGLRKIVYNNSGYQEIEIAERFIFDREKILGYSKLEEEKELDQCYTNNQIRNVITLHDHKKS